MKRIQAACEVLFKVLNADRSRDCLMQISRLLVTVSPLFYSSVLLTPAYKIYLINNMCLILACQSSYLCFSPQEVTCKSKYDVGVNEDCPQVYEVGVGLLSSRRPR